MTQKRPFALDLRYEVVTPLFLGGAGAVQPELRPASIRGAVRAWYRAIDPLFQEREGRWFGAAAEGEDDRGWGRPSPWRARVVASNVRAGFRLDRGDYQDLDRGTPPTKTNGVLYTGYTLMGRFNEREGFHAASARQPATFDVRLTVLPGYVREEEQESFAWALLGSHWLLGHLGGLGSRARRGWGSVQLQTIRVAPGSETHVPEPFRAAMVALSPARSESTKDWVADVQNLLATLAERFPGTRAGASAQTSHLGSKRRVLILREAHDDWAAALNHVAAELQTFRRAQHHDRTAVADHLLTLQTPPRAGAALPRAPLRAAFGLPLTFRFGIMPRRIEDMGVHQLRPDTVEFQPAEQIAGKPITRFPGPASLRVVRLADGWHGAVVRLDGARMGASDPSNDGSPAPAIGQGKVPGGRMAAGLAMPSPKIVDFWLDGLAKQGLEVPR